ncbi:tyrosine-type recombinase/integrase [Clostridium akagii]|uniref:tyrosine-type recombinase/integrase n=1 Tax=Clostridium akagii TaxID=91623 RepID=UPI0006898554|nr:site-specific integrase [Clostridium akagii]
MMMLVEQFKTNLFEDGKSANTVQSYVGDILGFIKYLRKMGVEFRGELRRFHIKSYRNYLVENNYVAATINKKINWLQSFNGFLMKNNYTEEIVVDLRKDRRKGAFGPEKQVEVFLEKQVERLLFYIQNRDKVSSRNRMIILLLMYTEELKLVIKFKKLILFEFNYL